MTAPRDGSSGFSGAPPDVQPAGCAASQKRGGRRLDRPGRFPALRTARSAARGRACRREPARPRIQCTLWSSDIGKPLTCTAPVRWIPQKRHMGLPRREATRACSRHVILWVCLRHGTGAEPSAGPSSVPPGRAPYREPDVWAIGARRSGGRVCGTAAGVVLVGARGGSGHGTGLRGCRP